MNRAHSTASPLARDLSFHRVLRERLDRKGGASRGRRWGSPYRSRVRAAGSGTGEAIPRSECFESHATLPIVRAIVPHPVEDDRDPPKPTPRHSVDSSGTLAFRNGFNPCVPRPLRVLLIVGGVYFLLWGAYVVKSAAGLDLVAYDAPVVGGHHGWMFPGSDSLVRWMQGS